MSNLQFIKLHIYALCTFLYICNIPDKRGFKNNSKMVPGTEEGKRQEKKLNLYLYQRLVHLKRAFIPVFGLKYLKENQAVLRLRIATIAFF